jgi:alpha-N-arabinofuranosidase
MGGEGRDLREANTADAPDRVAPRDGNGLGVEGGRLNGSLPPLSYHVIRLRKA